MGIVRLGTHPIRCSPEEEHRMDTEKKKKKVEACWPMMRSEGKMEKRLRLKLEGLILFVMKKGRFVAQEEVW
jgi:hypothetical protein